MQNTTRNHTPSIATYCNNYFTKKGFRSFLDQYVKIYKWTEIDNEEELVKTLLERKITHLLLDDSCASGEVNIAVSDLKKRLPNLRVLILQANYQLSDNNVNRHDAADCVLKNSCAESKYIEILLKFIYPDIENKTIVDIALNPFELLSDREKTALDYLIKGYRVKTIASKMHITSNTVATFKQRIFKKLKISNTIELYKITQQHNYIPVLTEN